MSKYNEIMDKVKVDDEMRKRILQNIEEKASQNVTAFETVKTRNENKIVEFIRTYGAVAAMFAVVLVGAYAVTRSGSMKEAAPTMESATQAPAEAPAEDMEYAAESAMEEAYETEAPEIEMENSQSADNAEPAMSPQPANSNKSETAGDSSVKEEGPSVMEEAQADEKSAEYTSLEYDSAALLSKAAGNEISDIESLLSRSKETHYILYDEGLMEIDYYVDGGNVYYRKAPESVAEYYKDADLSGEFIDYGDAVVETINGKKVTLKGNGTTYYLANWTTDGNVYSIIYDQGLTLEEMTDLIEETIRSN